MTASPERGFFVPSRKGSCPIRYATRYMACNERCNEVGYMVADVVTNDVTEQAIDLYGFVESRYIGRYRCNQANPTPVTSLHHPIRVCNVTRGR